MKPSEYIPLALRTVNDLGHEGNIDHACMLLLPEAVEVVDVVKKNFAYGRPLDTAHLMEELGDYMWGLNLLLKEMGRQDLWGAVEEAYETKSMLNPVCSDLANQVIWLGVCTGLLVSHAKCSNTSVNAIATMDNLCKSLGAIMVFAGLTLDQVLDANIAKLEARYPDLRFDPDRAINRDLEAEKGVLDVHS